MISKLVHSCGRDSVVPTVFAVEALQAGSETTGLQSAFLLYHVARCSCCLLHYYLYLRSCSDHSPPRRPDVQEKLYQEICDVIGPNGNLTGDITGPCSWCNIVFFHLHEDSVHRFFHS